MSIDPPVPAAMIALFATIRPRNSTTVLTNGRGEPVGHSVIWSMGPLLTGTSVTFSAYALAFDGAPHPPDGTGTVREDPPQKAGAPNAPALPDPTRVSMILHGVKATKRKLVANSWALASGAAAMRTHANAPKEIVVGLWNFR